MAIIGKASPFSARPCSRRLKAAEVTAVILAMASSAAHARPVVRPYLEVGQVLTADFENDDVVTFSTLTLGMDAEIRSQRTEVSLQYRYDRRFGTSRDFGDGALHTGIGRARAVLVPGLFSVDAGILATRARQNFRGQALQDAGFNDANSSQIFSAYLSPSLQHDIGPLDVSAQYRLGYSRASDQAAFDISAEAPWIAPFTSSVSQSLVVQFGMRPGSLPFGWSVSAGAGEDRQKILSSRFRTEQVRLDLTVPLNPSLALVGGVGKQWARATQRRARLSAEGDLLLDSKGRLIPDLSQPRQLTYDFSGLLWDAGVLWRPSARTNLEARIGRRLGSTSYTGSFFWQVRPNAGLQFSAYDEEETFGRELARRLDGLPSSFWTGNYASQLQGLNCSYASEGGGECLNGSLSGLTGAVFRSRGASLVWSEQRRRLSYGLGLGLNQRQFLGLARMLPDQKSAYGTLNVNYWASRQTRLGGDLVVSVYDLGEASRGSITSETLTLSAIHDFSRHLSGSASVGLSASQGALDDFLYGSARASLRYSF